jgi:hypothetical protein
MLVADVGGIKQRNIHLMPLNNTEFIKSRSIEEPYFAQWLKLSFPRLSYNFCPIKISFLIEDPNGMKSSNFERREIRRSESHSLHRSLIKFLFYNLHIYYETELKFCIAGLHLMLIGILGFVKVGAGKALLSFCA